jgi:hypothetical protein
MNCRQARAIIESDTESRLPMEAKGVFASHLASCPACRREKAAADALSGLLRSQPMETPPPGYWDSFWPRVSSRLSGETAPLPRRAFRTPFATIWPRVLALASAAAVLALAVIGGRYIVTGKPPGPSSPPVSLARRLPPSSDAGVDYVIARADRPRPAPEAHFVLARGRALPVVPASSAYSAVPSGHYILTAGSRGGRQGQIYW